MKTKHITSILLVICIVMSLLSTAAFAVDVNAFTDVQQAKWYYDDVEFVTAKDYFVGTSDTTFEPETDMARGMFVTVLSRFDQAEVDNNISAFDDVPANCYYTGAVTWASECGVVEGYGNNRFGPNDRITREQMCVILQRYIANCGNLVQEQPRSTEQFTDSTDISLFAKEAVESCRQWGLVVGYPDGSFDPQGCMSRAQAASVIHRLFSLINDSTDFSVEQAMTYAEEYSSFGIHRTGTSGDIATAQWISDTLGTFGMETEMQEITFDRFDYSSCEVIVDGEEIESFPFWFPKTTDGPVSGELAVYDESNPQSMAGKIVWYAVSGTPTNADISSVASVAAENGALGVIASSFSLTGHPWAQNAREGWVENELPLPAVVVSSQHKNELLAAAEEGKRASIRIEGEIEEDASAYNVIGKIDNGADQWIVITTPISGWFTCSAERGGGVGLFLEFARVFSSWNVPYNFLFMANTGHELNFMGAHASQAAYAPEPDSVKLWIHLGSAIAATAPDALKGKFQYSGFSDDMAEMALKYIGDVSEVVVQNDKNALSQSELGKFISEGYSTIGFYGVNYAFHTSADVDGGIDEARLGEIGEKTIKLLQNLLT